MGGKRSASAELVDPSGKSLQVEVTEDKNDMYFSDGWKTFVQDNIVQDGDFLFFKYHGNFKFSVVIYDETMCEKGFKFDDECSPRRDYIHEDKETKSTKRKRVERSQAVGKC